jgi:hypothetical protein
MPKAPAKPRKTRTSTSAGTASKVTKAANTAKTLKVTIAPPKEAAKRPRTFEDVIGDLVGPSREIARQLRQLIFDLIPGVSETAYGGSKVQLLLYSIDGPTKPICGLQPNGTGCLLYLHHVTPDDQQTLLIQGQGKHSQHVRVEDMTNSTVRDVRRLVTIARKRSKS